MTAPDRRVLIFARDLDGHLLRGATIEFTKNGVFAGRVVNSDGRGSIDLNRADSLIVSVTYDEQTQTRQLAQAQDDWTFKFDVRVRSTFMQHLPLIVGLGLLVLAVVLGFSVPDPTALQVRLILVVVSLAGGMIATEIPGMLKIDVTLGQKVAIGATGALGVFVLLYLVVPAT